MQHDRNPADDDRLIEQAKASARRLRREAVGVFWHGVGDATHRVLRAAHRLATRLAGPTAHVQPEG